MEGRFFEIEKQENNLLAIWNTLNALQMKETFYANPLRAIQSSQNGPFRGPKFPVELLP